MKNIIYAVLIVFGLSSCATKNVQNDKSTTETYQKELVEFYTNPSSTPLNQEEINIFKGITFFPIDNKYNLKADFQPIENGNVIPFPTSAGKIKHYKEYGTATFTIDGEEQTLTIYQSSPVMEEYKNHLFLPFTDDTNGDTTYGGGRYLDLDVTKSILPNGKILIDFNKAYNPYCAYSARYNCPIPPGNNSLDIEIKAGVTYKK